MIVFMCLHVGVVSCLLLLLVAVVLVLLIGVFVFGVWRLVLL